MIYLLISAVTLCLFVGISVLALALSPRLRSLFGAQSNESFNQLADPTNEDLEEFAEAESVHANDLIPKRLRIRQRDIPVELITNDEKLANDKKSFTDQQVQPLERKLKLAGWSISAPFFIALKVLLTLIAFIPAYLYTTMVIQLLVLFIVPKLVNGILRVAINRRTEEFDHDYPILLLQLVSFLKGGMIAITALREAANSLGETSLVRSEVDILIERLKLGLSEEQAIGAFAEDIDHPEIELFVQSFLLHCRTGGKLSATLERLAIQVRKRQQFRKEAKGAVASERISIFAITAIMLFILAFIFVKSPSLIEPSFYHELGKVLFQSGVAMIILGFYWSTRLTDIQM